MSVIAQYTHIHEDWFLGFEDPGLKDVQPINWVDTTYWDRSLGSRTGAYHTIRPQDDVRADVNYFLSNKLGADHSLKFGFAVRRSPVESINTVPGGAQARYRGIYDFVPGQYITTPSDPTGKRSCTINGVSYTANTVNGCDEANIIRDSDYTYTLYQRDLYINDSIRKNRATINLGLRYDHQHDIATPGTVPANRLLPAQLPAINFPGADSKARYNNWSPMAGVTFDLTGNGKTILKASARRYWGPGLPFHLPWPAEPPLRSQDAAGRQPLDPTRHRDRALQHQPRSPTTRAPTRRPATSNRQGRRRRCGFRGRI